MNKNYYACVYGGASDHIPEECIKEVERLGEILVDNGFSLVYGAGSTGCMGAVARGVHKKNGYVVGISPKFIRDFENIYDCDNLMIVDTMGERKTLMEKHADIFLVVPGGIGTMDEFFQVLTLKYLRQITCPIVVLNINGFYDKLVELMKSLVDQGATVHWIKHYFDVVNSVDDPKLLDYLNNIKHSR